MTLQPDTRRYRVVVAVELETDSLVDAQLFVEGLVDMLSRLPEIEAAEVVGDLEDLGAPDRRPPVFGIGDDEDER